MKTEVYKIAFSLKGEKGKNVSRANTVKHGVLNGTHFVFDDHHIGVGDTRDEAALEYIADSIGVTGSIEHESRKKLIRVNGGGYRP